MSVNLDPCFQYIFGLSETDCNCPEYADKPADYNQSDSNIFLDQLEGLNLAIILSSANCETGNIWDLMAKSRENGVKDLKHDLISCIASNSLIKREPYKGIIGSYKKFTKDLTLNTTYAGFRIRIADISGGYAILRRLGLLFNTTASKDITMYDSYGNQLAQFLTLPTQVNAIKWHDIPLGGVNISLDDPDEPYRDYNFVYPVDNIKPKDMLVAPDCCGTKYTPQWNDIYPHYSSPGDKGNEKWANWAMATGIKGNDISDIQNWSKDSYSNGIALGIDFGCKVEQTICKDTMDYVSNRFAIAMAYAARYRAGHLLIKYILSRPNISLYSTIPAENLLGLANEYQAAYEKRIYDFLCPKLSSPEAINQFSDCFTCKDSWGLVRIGLSK